MKLTANFTLGEFTRSDTATRLRIENTPDNNEIEKIGLLCIHLLQPLREKYGKPLSINSGFRCPELNKAVGGVPSSQHVTGEAADVRADNPGALLATLQEMGIEFDQAILYPTFLHLSYCHGKNRRQTIYAKGVQP